MRRIDVEARASSCIGGCQCARLSRRLTLAVRLRDPAAPVRRGKTVVAVFSIAAVLGGSVFQPAPTARAQPSQQTVSKIEQLIIGAPGITLQARSGKLALGSLHLEMSAKQPRFDASNKRVFIDDWRLTADLERDNVSVLCKVKEPTTGNPQTIEGWILGEGRPGGVPYEATGGKVDLSPRVQHQCWIRSYAWTPVLSAAARGHTVMGEEKIDGRLADKYRVDAPRDALDHIRPMTNLSASRGTVWLDRQTGALLKAIIDYKENFTEQRGSDKIIGTGEGHVEMIVTRVGKVTVKLPK
jgi:hypothetical protein